MNAGQWRALRIALGALLGWVVGGSVLGLVMQELYAFAGPDPTVNLDRANKALGLVGVAIGVIVGVSLAIKRNNYLAIRSGLPRDALAAPDAPGVDATAVPEQVSAMSPAPSDPYEALHRLHELHVAGAVTDEQFDAKRKELLDRM